MEVLSGHFKLAVMRALFPGDSPVSAGWQHTVSARRGGLSLWRIALWFTGDGQNFGKLRERNALTDEELISGQRLLIPGELLLPAFRATSAAAGAATRSGERSRVCARCRRRFRGLSSEDEAKPCTPPWWCVLPAAPLPKTSTPWPRSWRSSTIYPDVRDMRVGQRIRVPFDLLLPEFLPADNPRRLEYDKDRTESDKYSNTVRASRLEGITVILDAGHGGQDPGTMLGSTWESIYVYDIMLRVKRLFETTTAATVIPTTRDGSSERIHDRDVLPRSRNHMVLTTPPYAISDARVAANLRWYLANSRHRCSGQAFRRRRQDRLSLAPCGFIAQVPPRGHGLHPGGQPDPR